MMYDVCMYNLRKPCAKAALDGFTPFQICDKIRTEKRRFRKLPTK